MRNSDLSAITLIIFGDYNVLTNTPFQDHQPLHMLPGRVEYLTRLREQRAQLGGPPLRYAVTGNKGGVAYGLATEKEAEAEVRWTAEQIGAVTYAVCFAHPKPARGLEHYADPKLLINRKPKPGMLSQIITRLDVPPDQVLVVGTYADDCRAAQAAGLAYRPTGTFFRGSTPFSEDRDSPEPFLREEDEE